jgi:hypothetical protein
LSSPGWTAADGLADRDTTGPAGPEPAEGRGGRRLRDITRGLAVPVFLVAVLAPFALTFSGLESRTGEDLDSTRRERQGLVAMRPMARLVAVTAAARSAAVSGGRLDSTALKAAIAAVDATDATAGAGFGTGRRWADIRSRLERLMSSTPTSSTAFTSFGQAIDLEQEFLHAVVDASGLRVDPLVDAHYLIEATETRIPDIVTAAGTVADLTWLVEHHTTPARADTIAIAVAQSAVRQDTALLDDDLRKGFDARSSRILGPALLRELDELRDAAASIAPPVEAIGAVPEARPSTESRTASAKLSEAALKASAAALDQLDRILLVRIGELEDGRRTRTTVAVLGYAAAGAVFLHLILRRRGETRRAPAATPAEVDQPRQRRSSGARHREPVDLLSTQDLFGRQQFVETGRTIAPGPGRRGEATPEPEESR